MKKPSLRKTRQSYKLNGYRKEACLSGLKEHPAKMLRKKFLRRFESFRFRMQFLKGPMGFITATMFLNFMGLTIIIPVIPYIVAHYTTHVALFVGIITSLGALCQFLSGPVLGYA